MNTPAPDAAPQGSVSSERRAEATSSAAASSVRPLHEFGRGPWIVRYRQSQFEPWCYCSDMDQERDASKAQRFDYVGHAEEAAALNRELGYGIVEVVGIWDTLVDAAFADWMQSTDVRELRAAFHAGALFEYRATPLTSGYEFDEVREPA